MQTASDSDEPGSGGLNWRQRKKADMRGQLVNAYVRALGGRSRVTVIQLQDVERCVDLVLLAKTARAELAAGKTTINDVVKLEGAADRAVRRLCLPTSGRAAPGDDAWRKFLASQHATTDEGDG